MEYDESEEDSEEEFLVPKKEQRVIEDNIDEIE